MDPTSQDTLLRTVLEAWPDLVYVKDRQRRFIVANSTTANIMGAASPADMVGKTDFDFYPKDIAAAFEAAERAVLESGERQIDIEELAELPNGDQVWVSSTKIPLYDDDGAVCGLVGIGRDITDRKRTQDALRDQQALLMDVLESSPLAVTITRPPKGEVAFANGRLLDMFGLDRDALSQTKSADHYADPADRARLLAQVQENGRVENEEMRMKRSDGEVFWARLTIEPFVFDGSPALIGWIQDISKSRADREALHEREQFFRGLVESLKDEYIFYATDATGHVTYVSPSIEHLLGFTPEQAVGQHATVFAPPQLPTNAGLEERIERTLSGELLPSYLNAVPTRDGDIRLVETLDIPIRDESDRVVGVHGVARDVTAAQAAAAELHAAKDQAEQAVANLRRAQAELVEAEKRASLGQLTAGVAHEIKNPLNFVNNFAETSQELVTELAETLAPIQASLGGDTADDIADILETLTGDLGTIARHGHRADQIVKSMLMHARGDLTDRAATAINPLVDEAFGLAYHGERARNPGFRATRDTDLDPAAGDVEIVPQEITRVLVNLLSNAFYAVSERGRAETGGDYTPTVTVSTAVDGDHVVIRIRDNGPGIDAAARAELFNPFFTTKPTGEGTGLGLSISNDIVHHHGGQLSVASEPGVFTEFAVQLPRHAS